MPSTELDLPLVPSADQIRRREFATSRRGYDADQVRDYLRQIGDQVERLEAQVRLARATPAPATSPSIDRAEVDAALMRTHELEAERDRLALELADARAKAEATPSQQDAYEELARRMADVLRTAEQQAEQVRWQAEEDGRRVLEDARAEADRVRTDAQAKAEQTRGDADKLMDRSQEEADRLLAGLSSKRDALMSELEHMRERMLAMATSLGEIAGPVEESAEGGGSGSETKYFSESQLEQLWSVDAVPDVDLTLPEIPALGDDDTKGENDLGF